MGTVEGTMLPTEKPGLRARLDRLAEGAPRRRPNVRTLARFAANARCSLATLGFAAHVDFDHLLQGTRYAVPFGQSQFAFRRGNVFEDLLRKDGHRPLLDLLGSSLRYEVSSARVVNLRGSAAPTRKGMEARAARTAELISDKALLITPLNTGLQPTTRRASSRARSKGRGSGASS